MTSVISKRQQARNERALQDLIRTVPGNDRCADCYARNPGWASWSLGIFLCMRCAALHRKLGTHISKVKSLSMDAWSVEQVDHMKKNGNVVSNRRYNPRNVKADVPIDADEVDGALERFIRSKYQHQTLVTGKPPIPRKDSFDDENPPALPPKPPSGLGSSFRSASSTYPSRLAETPRSFTPTSATSSGGRQSNDWKLATLKDMGFGNDSKNNTVLKGVNGDLERAVESLVRLGEGGAEAQIRAAAGAKPPSRPRSPQRPPRFPSPPPRDSSRSKTVVNEASTEQPTQPARIDTSSGPNPYNPFQQPQQQPQTVSQNTQGLENAFNSMHLGTAAAVVPTYTGTFSTTSSQGAGSQTNPFLKTFTPPMSPNPYQSFQQSQQQNLYQPATPYDPGYTNGQQSNPFLRTSRSQNFAVSSNNYNQQTQPSSSFSSYQANGQQQAAFQSSPGWNQSPEQVFGTQALAPQATGFYQSTQLAPSSQPMYTSGQAQTAFFSSPSQSPLPQTQASVSPFDQAFSPFSQPQQQQQQQQQSLQSYGQPQQYTAQPSFQNQYPNSYQQQQQMAPQQPAQQPAQQLYAQPTGRLDKMSILSLYNAPHLAPPRLNTVQEDETVSQPSQAQAQQNGTQPRRSVTMPAPGTHNPFAGLLPNGARTIGGPSRESVDFVALQGGRHSPDAFKGLSARYV